MESFAIQYLIEIVIIGATFTYLFPVERVYTESQVW